MSVLAVSIEEEIATRRTTKLHCETTAWLDLLESVCSKYMVNTTITESSDVLVPLRYNTSGPAASIAREAYS